MKMNYKISIPKPCHEDWDKMTEEETGRFCNSCAKSVIDFTGMKTAEIQDFFIQNKGQKVCGRFKTEQLDSIVIQIPTEVLYSQVQFHKIFMLALLVCMGTTLFSCQSEEGTRKKIDGVEVTDTIQRTRTLGMILPPKVNTPKTDTVCAPIGTKGEVIVNGDVAITPSPQTTPVNKEYYTTSEVDILPSFPDGMGKFYDYIIANFKIPDDYQKENRTMFVNFIIEKDGNITTIKVIRGLNEKLDAEAVRILENSPKWNAGEVGGEKVRVRYTLPIRINAK